MISGSVATAAASLLTVGSPPPSLESPEFSSGLSPKVVEIDTGTRFRATSDRRLLSGDSADDIVFSALQAAYLTQHDKRLLDFTKRSTGWTGYPDSIAAHQDTVKEVGRFLQKLPIELLRKARLELSGDGEISCVWKSGESYAEFAFLSGEPIAFYVEDSATGIDINGDLPLSQIDSPAFDLLSRLFNASV